MPEFPETGVPAEVASHRNGVRYGRAVADEIVRRTEAGESLLGICRSAGMPNANSVCRWLKEKPQFAAAMQEARARAGTPLRGRRPLWCVETAEIVVRRVADGEALCAVCADAGLPSIGTVYGWKRQYPEFRAALDEAYEIRGEVIADRSSSLVRRMAEEGWGGEGPGTSGVEPRRAYALEVMLKHARWYVGKVAPKRFGAKKAVAPEEGPRRVDLIVKTFKIGVGEDGEPTVFAIAPNPETGVVERVDEGKWPGVEGAKGFVGEKRKSPSPLSSPSPLRGGRGDGAHDPEGWL